MDHFSSSRCRIRTTLILGYAPEMSNVFNLTRLEHGEMRMRLSARVTKQLLFGLIFRPHRLSGRQHVDAVFPCRVHE